MNKNELIHRISIRTNTTKCKTTTVLNAIIDVISDTLAQGDKVQIVGFGTFETHKRAEKKGHNPQTKQEIRISARKAPIFKPAKILKDSLKNKS